MSTTRRPAAVADAELPMRARLVSARLLTLLPMLRISADLRYGRELGLNELNRRIISMTGRYGGLTSVELVSLTGQEKAQISRAVSKLTGDGLVARASLRAPVTLTADGHAIYERVNAIAADRNAKVTQGIASADLQRFGAMTARLIERAALLFAQERDREARSDGSAMVDPSSFAPPLPERLRPAAGDGLPGGLVVPPLITLSAYLGRSATLAYRRETGLSHFTWRVMAQIGEHQPLALAALIGLIQRDKSQVGRAVKWLEGEGLVARRTVRTRRDVTLACTAAGEALYSGMCDSARLRDDFLFAGCAASERADYLAALDLLTTNAAELLAYEQAVG